MSRRLPRLHARRGLSVAALGLCCALTACSGGSDSGEIGSDSSESSGGADASGSPGEVSEEAVEPTRQGAVAFVEHWVTVLGSASNTGDTEPFLDLTESDCVACGDVADGIHQLYLSGGSLTSDGWKVLDARATLRPAQASGGQVTGAVVDLRVNRTPEALYRSADSKAEVFRGGKQRYLVRLVRVDDHWSVREFSPVKQGAGKG